MYETSEQITVAMEKLIQVSLSFARGDLLPWTVIEETIGAGRDSAFFRYIVVKFRKHALKERKIAMRAEMNEGLRFLTHQQQVRRCAEDRHRKMFRQSSRAMKEIGAIDAATLSLHDRSLRLSQIDRLKVEQKAIRASVKEVRKTDAPPIRKSAVAA